MLLQQICDLLFDIYNTWLNTFDKFESITKKEIINVFYNLSSRDKKNKKYIIESGKDIEGY